MAYNVLIVDDSKTTRDIIEKALRVSGLPVGEVKTACDGLEAIALLGEQWVDVVFADLNMPRMSGAELIERMSDDDLIGTIPVVIVSTEGREARIEALLARGAAAFIRKPFTPEQIASTVRTLLEGAEHPVDADVIAEAFYNAVEGFAMLVAAPLDESPPAPERAVIARMSFEGPGTEGRAAIAAPEGACEMVARVATGDPGAHDGCDALMELLNVMCGHLVDTIPGGPFHVSQPSSATADGDAAWAEVSAMGTWLAFDVEGVPMLVGVAATGRWVR